jgi:ribosomal protein S18 acetylase RimI-like enzyme
MVAIELFRPGDELDSHKDDLWNVLQLTDRDFVPKLSAREPTTLGELKPSKVVFQLPIEHLDFLLQLHVFIAISEGKAVGFLSFLPGFRHEVVPSLTSCVLIDTVAVIPSFRRKGIARDLYRALFASPLFQSYDDAVLHTWSTNATHGVLIEELGFEKIRIIENERAPGIHTEIWTRPTKPNPFEDD